MKINNRIAMTFAGAGLLAAGANAATFTTVEAPSGNELTHEQILEEVFAVDLVQNGLDFEGGGVTLTRVDDDQDQSYDFLEWTATALASWASAGQSFGTAADGILFDVVGKRNQTISGSYTDGDGGSGIHFGRFGNECDTVDVTTDAASNPNGKDHVVTYKYEGGGETKYYLFFEDANETSDTTDWDYNDLVVEVSGSVIPEPTSLALLGLGGLAMIRRRR